MNPTELSEEMRNKLAAKAKNKPDYKTRDEVSSQFGSNTYLKLDSDKFSLN